MRRILLIGGALIGVIVAGFALTRPPQEINYEAQIISAEAADLPSLGFAEVSPDYAFSLPEDANPHPQYQREVWTLDFSACYEDGRRVTFERLGLIAPEVAPHRDSAWAFESVILATASLPDLEGNRYGRVAQGLAGAEAGRIWLENWSLRWDENASEFTLSLGEFEVVLTAENSPETAILDTAYELRYRLRGEVEGQACEVGLVHRFGAG